jgi:acetylornithine deacetylase/succinyl-diaminopimelate desuccinylase-like protein
VEIAGIDPELVACIERETTELLSALIAIDTSNPPGNESAVAEFLDDYFRGHGLRGEICGEPAERRSFAATLRGARPGPRLVLMAHEDVVPAAAGEWTEPPFAGVVKDGYIWGRGAVDVKNHRALQRRGGECLPEQRRSDRRLPQPVGWNDERVATEVATALAGAEARWELSFVGTVEANASPADSPLRDAVTAVMARLVPGSHVVPLHSVGFTDSNWSRAAFPDVVAYNFAPFLVDDGAAVSPRLHNVDERIAVRDLAFQSVFAFELVKELLG